MNRAALEQFRFAPVEHRYSLRDTMLYALGLGYGDDPLDARQLRYVFEQGEQPLLTVPSMAFVLGYPGAWFRNEALGLQWQKLLHGAQSLEVHQPLANTGHVRAEHVFEAVDDRGPEKGAQVHLAKRLFDAQSNQLLATVRSLYVLRGDGGCGSFGIAPKPTAAIDAALVTTHAVDVQTAPNSALVYRLSGDLNPLHADPRIAKQAGFDRPILHGLCTLGSVLRACLGVLAPETPDRITALDARFTSPVYPGERLHVEIFDEGSMTYRFRARVLERDVVVLDRGTLRLGPPGAR